MRDFATLFGPLARKLGSFLGLEIIRTKTHRGISFEKDLKPLLVIKCTEEEIVALEIIM